MTLNPGYKASISLTINSNWPGAPATGSVTYQYPNNTLTLGSNSDPAVSVSYHGTPYHPAAITVNPGPVILTVILSNGTNSLNFSQIYDLLPGQTEAVPLTLNP